MRYDDTFHDKLDELLDSPCELCERPYRWCECVTDCAISGTVYEGDVIAYLMAWGGLVRNEGTVMRLYASWRRANGRNRR